MKPIIIIGTGLAGYTLAREFRKLDSSSPLTIITADDGAFYSKPLLSNALSQSKTAEALATSSAAAMAEQLDATIVPNTQIKQIDPNNKLVISDDLRWRYHKLILAVGAQQSAPPLAGDAVSDIVTVNDLQDYAVFRNKLKNVNKVAIIGAGFVGCEFANDLINNNIAVDIIGLGAEPFDHLLPNEIGQALRHALEAKGVTWRRSCSAIAINHSVNDYQIQLSNGETVQTQLVLSSTGLQPNIQLAINTGIPTRRGILANNLLETQIADIYTLGDCLELNGQVLTFVMPLMQQARALAKTLTGQPTPVAYPAMPLAVKTPAYPITALIPSTEIKGKWQIETQDNGIKALYHDLTGKLHGFALGGEAVKEKGKLIKLVDLNIKDAHARAG